jgi:hypothetical protein
MDWPVIRLRILNTPALDEDQLLAKNISRAGHLARKHSLWTCFDSSEPGWLPGRKKGGSELSGSQETEFSATSPAVGFGTRMRLERLRRPHLCCQPPFDLASNNPRGRRPSPYTVFFFPQRTLYLPWPSPWLVPLRCHRLSRGIK